MNRTEYFKQFECVTGIKVTGFEQELENEIKKLILSNNECLMLYIPLAAGGKIEYMHTNKMIEHAQIDGYKHIMLGRKDLDSGDIHILNIDGVVIEYLNGVYPTDDLQFEGINLECSKVYIDSLIQKNLENNGMYLQFVKNPSVDMIVTAVTNNGLALQYVDNQSEELQLLALDSFKRCSDCFLNYCNDDRADLIRYCIPGNQDYGFVIMSADVFKNLSQKMLEDIISFDGKYIRYVVNPSTRLQVIAVQANPFALKYIVNPSDEVVMAALELNPYSLHYVDHQTSIMIECALDADLLAIEYVKNQTESLQLAVLDRVAKKLADFAKESDYYATLSWYDDEYQNYRDYNKYFVPTLLSQIINPTILVKAKMHEVKKAICIDYFAESPAFSRW